MMDSNITHTKNSNITNIRIGQTGNCTCCHRTMPSIIWKRKDSGKEMTVCAECGVDMFLDVFIKRAFRAKMPKWNTMTEEEEKMIVQIESVILAGESDDAVGYDGYEE